MSGTSPSFCTYEMQGWDGGGRHRQAEQRHRTVSTMDCASPYARCVLRPSAGAQLTCSTAPGVTAPAAAAACGAALYFSKLYLGHALVLALVGFQKQLLQRLNHRSVSNNDA